ncbi:MAG: AzlC family ABC transporter permease [Clostridia bacterium]|nr:AzlC family ABC transporter permease [Clostridia bacterium]
MKKDGRVVAALRAAFPKTIPILAGFWFIGLTYGMYMHASGFSFIYPMIMSIVILGGSLEFVAVSLLTQPFNPIQAFAVTVMIQARHLFYSIAMLEKYKDTGLKKPYLIFGMCDETFSINCSADIPPDIDRGWFYFWVTILDHFYWVSGATMGGILGSVLVFDTTGLDFVLTAMFIVIFLEQWLKEKNRASAYIGFAASIACLMIFGADNFLVPSMIAILVSLTFLRGPIERVGV